jgi:hypothetical protein
MQTITCQLKPDTMEPFVFALLANRALPKLIKERYDLVSH